MEDSYGADDFEESAVPQVSLGLPHHMDLLGLLRLMKPACLKIKLVGTNRQEG